jgi:hypothetical protein
MPDARVEQVRAGCELLRLVTSPANALEILRVFFNTDVSDAIGPIKSDTLVLHAREDPIIPFNEGRTLASLIPMRNSSRSKAAITSSKRASRPGSCFLPHYRNSSPYPMTHASDLPGKR